MNDSDDFKILSDRIYEYERELKDSRENLKHLKDIYGDLYSRKKSLDEALNFVIEVDIKTRENLEFAVSKIASEALLSIFEDEAYQLETDFVSRRGQTECDIVFKKGGRSFADPEFESGGGAVNVASYALRISIMTIGEVMPVLIADQPFRDLSAKYHSDFIEFFKKVSEEMGMQMIMISHLPEQIQSASKTFKVSNGSVKVDFQNYDKTGPDVKKKKRRRSPL